MTCTPADLTLANQFLADAPASSVTVTLFDSDPDGDSVGYSFRDRFPRIQVNINSSHDSAPLGVTFEESQGDGLWTTLPTISAQTYATVDGETIYDVPLSKEHVRVKYVNGANTLTRWRVTVVGVRDRSPTV